MSTQNDLFVDEEQEKKALQMFHQLSPDGQRKLMNKMWKDVVHSWRQEDKMREVQKKEK